MENSEIKSEAKVRVRVGILLNDYKINFPYYHILETLKKSEYAEICLVVLNSSKKKVTAKKIFGNLNYVFFHAYQKLDHRFFKPKHSVLNSRDSKPLLEGITVLETEPVTKNYFQWIQEEDLEKIKSHNIDVFIRMGFKILKGGILKSSKYGIWSYHHADNKINRGGPPGFWEMYENNPVTGTIVQILSEDLDNGNVLAKTIGTTHKYSLKLSRNSAYAKGMFLLPRLIRKLYEEGSAFIDKKNTFPELYSQPLYTTPTNAQVMGFLFRMIPTSFLKFVKQFFFRNQWFLMYHLSKNGSLQPSMRKMKKLLPPKGTFWADPHLVFRDNKYYVFLEEQEFSKKNAHISVLTIDEKGNCSKAQKVLEQPYHLSYPFVFSYDGNDYMIPESKANSSVELYKCDEFPSKWSLHSVLMKDVMALDTTLHFHNKKWWMFVNRIDHPAVSSNDELYIYYAASPLGPWLPHRQNPVISDVRRARPAGKIFQYQGKTYRPSQDCSKTYGYGIRINEILRLDENHYEEKEIDFIEPLWDKSIKGTHSFVLENNLTMIDCFRKVSKWL